ncbi:major facilitator superfamily domain-containing protein [Podospora aff. communis PSN243]|uniref:Major facilitator superfamily domain-containing protein n=1 Tax=Podospora aff. communis PSN243 TaxID=3040156 RepID=A0AAV9H3G6_9PEZI|nr:major facilitator superfamily domain-containing protein [Podospora aff. communis PSN243]
MASSIAALAKFATFTDAFLSGLVIPLLPSIIKSRVHVPAEQVPILNSILVAAYGGASVAVSPLLPLVAVNGRRLWVTILGGLVCAAGAFVLLQFYSYLPLLILARALQGLSAAAFTGAYCGITSAGPRTVSWATPTVVQSAAMAAAPAIAGYLHDNAGGEKSVFYCAYALVALTALLWLVAFVSAPSLQLSTGEQAEETLTVEQPAETCGTMTLRGGGGASGYSSISSTRTSSSIPHSGRSRRSSIGSEFSEPEEPTPVFGIRLFTALYGYFTIAFVMTALQSLIPLFATRQFGWGAWSVGLALVPMSAPAVFVSLLADFFTSRVPRSARFVVTLGFLICIPAFAHLGQLDATSPASASAALTSILALVSFGIGHSGDPLFREIWRLTSEVEGSLAHAGYLSSTTASFWGSLLGPLVTGFIQWRWGWYSVAKFLVILCGFAAVLTLMFLQGWIGNPQPISSHRAAQPGTDEESAPLLAHSSQRGTSSKKLIDGNSMPRNVQKSDLFDRNNTSALTDSSDFGSIVRTDGERRVGRHRRHFSIDNFSIATTAVAGQQTDQDPQVRFQAALETPALMGSSFKQQLGNPERRFVMREAPHAPATDSLLASGSRYVIDESGADGEVSKKRHVVVFEEGAVPAELLERRQHHVVAINSLDGSVKLAPSTENHAVHVTEEAAEHELPETSRRYVVVLLEKGDIGEEPAADETT